MRTGHAIADDGENAARRHDFDTLNLALAQFAVERLAHDGLGASGLGFRDRETDGMLGTALRDQDDRNAMIAQCAEQTMRGTGDADHAGAFQVDERNPIDTT